MKKKKYQKKPLNKGFVQITPEEIRALTKCNSAIASSIYMALKIRIYEGKTTSWPSYEQIALDIGYEASEATAKRTIKRCLEKLIEVDLIEVEWGKGLYGGHLYRIKQKTNEKQSRHESSGGRHSKSKGVDIQSPETSRHESRPNKKKILSIDKSIDKLSKEKEKENHSCIMKEQPEDKEKEQMREHLKKNPEILLASKDSTFTSMGMAFINDDWKWLWRFWNEKRISEEQISWIEAWIQNNQHLNLAKLEDEIDFYKKI